VDLADAEEAAADLEVVVAGDSVVAEVETAVVVADLEVAVEVVDSAVVIVMVAVAEEAEAVDNKPTSPLDQVTGHVPS